MNINAQHFLVWQQFNRQIYRTTLTTEHIINSGKEKFVDAVHEIEQNGAGSYKIKEGRIIDRKCIFLEKDGTLYIMPSEFEEHLPLNVKESFECYLKPSDKTVYTFITKPSSVKIGPVKTLSFKELIQVFNPMSHTDPQTWTFLKLQAIASKAKGTKMRLCSSPACGKNSNDVILNMITNDNVRVSQPTIAKLETLFYYNQKVLPDELTSLTSTQVREIEPFFLTIADESPTFEKHSMARKRDLNQVDIAQASCIFTYNDPKSLQKNAKFFDEIWQNIDAFNSRYPAVYLTGEITSSPPKLSIAQAQEIMLLEFEKLKEIAKNIVYYIQNMNKEMHGYSRDKVMFKGRHLTNMEAILDALDVISDTQQEFDAWIDWLTKRVLAYKKLTQPPEQHPLFVTEEEVVL